MHYVKVELLEDLAPPGLLTNGFWGPAQPSQSSVVGADGEFPAKEISFKMLYKTDYS